MMSLFERTSEDLNSSKLVLHHFNDSFQAIQSHICSMISLSEQWSNFHNSFVSIQASLAKNLNELEVKEREIDSLRSKLNNQQEEAKLVRISLNDGWKEVALRQKAVEKRENDVNAQFEELGLEKKRVKEWRKAVEAGAKRVKEREKEVEEMGRSEGFEERERLIEDKEKLVEEREKAVEERCKAVERREKELEERSEAVEEGENGVNKRCIEVERREKAVEVREEEVDQRIRELEAKEEGIDERCRLIELEEKRIEERGENVGLMEREVQERCEAHELRDKQLSERCEGLEFKEKGLIEKMEEMEMKEKLIDERCKAVESREGEIDDRCKVIELKESEIGERWKEHELRDKELNERCKGLELKERRIDERLRELELKGIRIESKLKQTDEACEKLELKRKQMKEHTKRKNLNDKQLREKCGGLGINNRDKSGMEMNSEPQSNVTLRQCVMKDGETLQMFLNDRVDEHRFMDEEVSNALKLSRHPPKLVLDALNGFYPPHLKKGNVVYEASVVRSSCVLLLKQLMNMKCVVSKKRRKRAKWLAFRWKDKMVKEGENQIVVLSFLLLVVAYDLRSYFERNELQRLYEILNKDRTGLQLRRELNLPEGSSMATEPNEVKTRQLQPNALQVTDVDASSAMNHCNKVYSLCHSMDASGLRSYIGLHLMEQSFYLEKVRGALQCAPDPGKLLLDVVQIFNQPGSTAVEIASCIFLLELLMKLQKQQSSLNFLGQTEQLVKPPVKITHNLRQKAKEFAFIWKQKLSDKGCKLLEAYSFLQFVATYQLERSFKEDELLQLFKLCYKGNSVYRPEQNPRLCHALGLTKRIPGLINTLVKGHRLLAVKYICTFMMESHFPLVPLLKDHLKAIEKKAAKLQEGKNCHAAKIDSARFEVHNLKAVLQHINYYRLEAKLSPVPLESRIEELEIQIAEVKTATTDEELGAIERKEGLKDNISADLVMGVEEGPNELEKEENISLLQASPADRSKQSGGNKRTSSPCNSLELSKIKRLRAGDPESPVSPNVPTASPLNTHSGSTQLSPQPMRQPGPCTSGHQSLVRPNDLPVLPPETLPAVSRSSVQYGYPLNSNGVTPYGCTGQFGPIAGICPGGSNVELKTASSEVKQVAAIESTIVEKDKLEKNTSHMVNEPEKKLSPSPYAQTASDFGGNKQSSSPCSSLVSPQQAKHLRPETLQSPFPSNIPIARPVTTHSVPMNPQPSPQPWRQPGPYPFEHQAYVRSNGPSAWHPGPWPAVNGSNAHIGVPGGNYGTPYGGTAQFDPAGTWNGQLNPAGFFHYGNPPRPGYFVRGQVPYRPR